jgi:DNA polymerase
MMHAHGDFESRSTVDLKAAGLHNYANHPDTSPWCFAWAIGDEEPAVWLPGQQFPERLRTHLAGGGLFFAHNCAFEYALWNTICVPRYGWPPLDIAQCRCTMSQAYSMALPGSLEKAAAALGITEQKDMAGGRLMMQMARPRSINPDGTIVWWSEPDKLAALYEYCRQDVRVERALEKRLLPLSDAEQRLWVLDQKINNRGVYVDTPAVRAAIEIVVAEQDRLNKEMRRVTGGFVSFCTEAARLTKWVQSRGVAVPGIAKGDVIDALEQPNLPDDVRAALLLRQQAGKSSTAKLQAMISAASADGRLRGMLQYHGAGTGRWAGRRVQLHNMPRPKIEQDEIERAIEFMAGAQL